MYNKKHGEISRIDPTLKKTLESLSRELGVSQREAGRRVAMVIINLKKIT